MAYFVSKLSSKKSDNPTVNLAGVALREMKDPSSIGPLIDALVTTHKFKVGSGGGEGSISPTFGNGPGGSGGGLSMGGKPQYHSPSLHQPSPCSTPWWPSPGKISPGTKPPGKPGSPPKNSPKRSKAEEIECLFSLRVHAEK